jgi:hypothetical protein
MLINTAYADNRHLDVLNPLWLPVEILSSVATAVSALVLAPFVYVQHGYSEPRQTVIYEEPRQYRHERYYDRGPDNYYYNERGRGYDAPQYRDYR